MKDINIDEINKIVKDKDTVIIDVRTEGEYTKSHIGNAILIPIYELEYKIKKIGISKDTNIIIYCSTGMKSKNAR